MKPFLIGSDIMNEIDSNPSRTIIDFGDMSYDESSKYVAAFSHVENKVKPFRAEVNRKSHRDNWWKYGDVRQGLRASMANLSRVLVSGQTVKYLCFSWCPTSWVFDQKCVVIATESNEIYSVLNSNLYNTWARKFSGTTPAESLSFAPSDAYETFPFPPSMRGLEEVGILHEASRSTAKQLRGVGLTDLYNAYHDPKCTDDEICALREAHQIMENAVFESYGWSDLDRELDFRHENPQLENGRVRFAISGDTSLAVLRRLAALNRQRHQDESAQGAQAKMSGAGKARARRSRAGSTSELTLNLGDIFSTTFEEGE